MAGSESEWWRRGGHTRSASRQSGVWQTAGAIGGESGGEGGEGALEVGGGEWVLVTLEQLAGVLVSLECGPCTIT